MPKGTILQQDYLQLDTAIPVDLMPALESVLVL